MAVIIKPSYLGIQFVHRANGRVHAYHRKTRTPIRAPFGTPEFRIEVDALNRGGIKTKVAAERRRARRSTAGVYLLIRDNRVVYIGTSEDMPTRVVAHRSNGRQFDRAYYIHATGKDRFALERLLIAAIRPDQNTQGTGVKTGANGNVNGLYLGPK